MCPTVWEKDGRVESPFPLARVVINLHEFFVQRMIFDNRQLFFAIVLRMYFYRTLGILCASRELL